MTDRKYRQRGYQSPDAAGGPRRPEPPRPAEAPRGGMLGRRSVSRCGACGAVLPIATSSLEQCPSCRADIHACCQCAHFDPGKRFQCAEPVPERQADKNAKNDCAAFALRVTVERDATPDSTRPADVRRGFDNLFKS